MSYLAIQALASATLVGTSSPVAKARTDILCLGRAVLHAGTAAAAGVEEGRLRDRSEGMT